MFPLEEVVALPLTKSALEIETLVVEALARVERPVAFKTPRLVVPETVSELKVPTEVRAEERMFAPREVPSKTFTLLMVKAPPEARLMLPAVKASPAAKVELAVVLVAMSVPTVKLPTELEEKEASLKMLRVPLKV